MSSSDLISPEGSGYHVVKLSGLGKVHLEYSSRVDKKNNSTLWEASVYTFQDGSGSLRTILHIIADSRSELIEELDRAFFSSPKTD